MTDDLMTDDLMTDDLMTGSGPTKNREKGDLV